MRTMLLIFNPKAGQEIFCQHLYEVVDKFTKHGFSVTVHPTQGRRDAYEVALSRGANYDYLVCSGGDGTLNEVIDALMCMPQKPQLGYIPSGSTNDFAYTLGLPTDVLLAADTICNGVSTSIDIGAFQEEYFSYVAAFGLFTDVSYGTSQSLKNMLGHAAYVLEGVKRLTSIKSHRCTVVCDGEEIDGDFIFGMVTNSASIGGFKLPMGASPRTDNGSWNLIMLKDINHFSDLQDVIGRLLGSDKACSSIIVRTAREIRVTSGEPLDWTLDGEYGGSHTNVDIRICPGAVQIMVPQDTEHALK